MASSDCLTTSCFGSGFNTFDKFGLKFKPIGVTFNKRFNAAFTMRWYPNGFTGDEFGIGPRQDFNRDGEMLYGQYRSTLG